MMYQKDLNQPVRLFAMGAMAFIVSASAHASSIGDAFAAAKPIIDARLRYERVDQDTSTNANATTLRARLGFETGKAWGTSMLLEGEFITPIVDNYRADPDVNKNTQYPVVADPEEYAINRFQFVNTSITNTTITLGRQRINLDDQRFIGSVGWRQNEQTFDALRVVNKPIDNLVLDFTYANRANRIFGHDSPQGAYTGDLFLLNVSYQFNVGKLTVFDYKLDGEEERTSGDPLDDGSTNTLGVRFAGSQPVGPVKLGYAVSYATQSDSGDSTVNIDNDYFLAEVSAAIQQFTVGIGNEILQGDGTVGFLTPFATAHKFQGWADKFLNTPVNGMDDLYINAGYTLKNVGPLASLGFTGAYHTFKSERGSTDYGTETDLQVQAKWNKFTAVLKYADYSKDQMFTDTSKLWAQVEYVW